MATKPELLKRCSNAISFDSTCHRFTQGRIISISSTYSCAGSEEIQSTVVSIVVKHTGYPEDFIEMDQDLEGELGIDTVKQAEIMGDVREHFSLPLDEDFVLADHPTLNHFVPIFRT